MSLKVVNKYAVITISILIAELINAHALAYLQQYKSNAHPYRSVAISMVVSVLIFYPAFLIISKYLKPLSNKYMLGMRKVTKNNFLGILVGFSLAIVLLFIAFADIWYNRNAFMDLIQWVGW